MALTLWSMPLLAVSYFSAALKMSMSQLSTVTNADMPAPQVDLRFTRSPAGKTYLSRQLAGYPYHAGRLLKNKSEQLAMLLLQSTSGGLFEHDRIGLHMHVASGGAAQVKHAAATVVHSMTHGHAQLTLQLTVEAGAYLEYVANLSILFPSSSLISQIEVNLHPGAVAVISDAYRAHVPEPRQQQSVNGGSLALCLAPHFNYLDASMTVFDATRTMLVRDRFVLTGQVWQQQLAGVSASYDTQGGIFILMSDCNAEQTETLLALVAAAVAKFDVEQAYIGYGSLPNRCGAFVRILACGGEPISRIVAAVAEAVSERYAQHT
jgi:urease accessory protein